MLLAWGCRTRIAKANDCRSAGPEPLPIWRPDLIWFARPVWGEFVILPRIAAMRTRRCLAFPIMFA
jgi:hypothetical protein